MIVESEETMRFNEQQEPRYIPKGRLARLTFRRDWASQPQVLGWEVAFGCRPTVTTP